MSEEKRKQPVAHPIRNLITKAILSTGNTYTAAVDTVSAAVRTTVTGAHNAGASAVLALTQVALGAIRGALEIGTDVSEAARGILVGVLHGTRERGEASLRTISHTARTVIHHTAITGSDVTAATTGLIEGALRSALDFGGDPNQAAAAAAQGASAGAEMVGFAASEQVRTALRGHFEGVSLPLVAPYQAQDH